MINSLKEFLSNEFHTFTDVQNIIQLLKNLEDLFFEAGKHEIADSLAETLDLFYPYDVVKEILGDKDGAIVDIQRAKLIKTPKGMPKICGGVKEPYFYKINCDDYVNITTPRSETRIFVGNYWYVFIRPSYADMEEIVAKAIKLLEEHPINTEITEEK